MTVSGGHFIHHRRRDRLAQVTRKDPAGYGIQHRSGAGRYLIEKDGVFLIVSPLQHHVRMFGEIFIHAHDVIAAGVLRHILALKIRGVQLSRSCVGVTVGWRESLQHLQPDWVEAAGRK